MYKVDTEKLSCWKKSEMLTWKYSFVDENCMSTGHCALQNGGFTPKKEAVILIFLMIVITLLFPQTLWLLMCQNKTICNTLINIRWIITQCSKDGAAHPSCLYTSTHYHPWSWEILRLVVSIHVASLGYTLPNKSLNEFGGSASNGMRWKT